MSTKAIKIRVKNAINALGTGKCVINKCSGCKQDAKSAIEELKEVMKLLETPK